MKEQNKNFKEKVEEILKNTEEYEDYEIDYMFINDYKNTTLTYASVDDKSVRIISNLENGHNIFDYVEDWDFGFGKDFFENLEKYWEIGFISDSLHPVLWNYINDYYPDDIDSKNGVQVYLQYCADKGINKEFLIEKGYNYIPDVMQYFNGLGLQETMNYKGLIIEADDVNSDNPKENLVNIYSTKEDYNKKIPNKTISLNTINLRDNIANYIDNNYIPKNKEQLGNAKKRNYHEQER